MDPEEVVCLDDDDGPVAKPRKYSGRLNCGSSFGSSRSGSTRGTSSTSREPMSSVKADDEKAEDERRWYVGKSFFDARTLVADTITSYNNFVNEGIPRMFEDSESFEVVPETTFGAEGGITKVIVWFSDPELASKPEVDHEDREIHFDEDSEAGEFTDEKSGKNGKVSTSWFVDAEPNGGEGAACGLGGAGASTSATVAGKGKEKVSKAASRNSKPNETMSGNQPGAEKEKSSKGKRKASESNTSCDDPSRRNDAPWADQSGAGKSQLNGSDVHDQSLNWNLDLDIPFGVAEKDLDDLLPKTSGEIDEDLPTHVPGKEKTQSFGKKAKAPSSPGIGHRTRSKRPKLVINIDDDEDDAQESDNKKPARENVPSSPAVEKLQGKYFAKERRKMNYKLLPFEARLRGMTYSSPLYVKVNMEIHRPRADQHKNGKASTSKPQTGNVTLTESRVLLGKIPVMVKSSLCHLGGINSSEESPEGHGDCCLDPGGYFIIKGSEKVVVAQEERNGQKVWLSNLKGIWIASYAPRRKGFTDYNHRKTLVKLTPPAKKDDGLQKGFLPLFTEEILDGNVLLDEELVEIVVPSLKDADNQLTRAFNEWDQDSFRSSKRDVDISLYCIGSKSKSKHEPDEKLKHGEELLMSRFLPHIEDKRSKAYFLSHMVRTICFGYLGRQQPTDKDDIKNKRLEFAGEVLSHQFRKLVSHVQNTMKKRIQKHLSKNQELVSVDKYVEEKVITRGFRNAFSSGNWMGRESMKNSGIVFDLKRGNPISTLCQLRELRQYVPPLVKVGEDARQPTFSQWGRVCPIDTPDGESCGLVKNLALTGIVSCTGTETPVLDCFGVYGVEPLESLSSSRLGSSAKVFLNGRWVGVVDVHRAQSLVDTLRRLRRRAPTPELSEMEVIDDAIKREVHVSTDGGRVLRPLLVVKDNRLNLNLQEVSEYISKKKGEPQYRFAWFLKKEVIELLGVEEEEKALIAFHGGDLKRARQQPHLTKKKLKFSHAEIHPSLILGLSASLIPFPNRNQSARNLFQAHKHSKQAIGLYVTNLACRADTSGQHLFYPQVQLVKTHVVNCIQKDEIFSGQNAVVAIACYTGYNQEDSIIMDQSALDRGMFRTQHYRTFKAEERPEYEIFGKPSAVADNGSIRALSSDRILEEDGLPFIGCDLRFNDVIIGKTAVKKEAEPAGDSRMTDVRSTRLKAHEKGRVDQVILVQDEEGKKCAKVKLREMRIPQVGDKFSSMHGQKGIVGMVFTQEDLPFTQEGIVPDIVINPHAFPSRQTLGQMCESALGKATAKQGTQFLATPFIPASTVEWITDVLHQSGYNGWGTETMYNGFTGKAMEAKIFIGTTFYQRLTHMVQDKIKYRSRGQVHPLTRQPVSDRKRHGGVKFGEMERDCLIAHGAAATLQERTFHLSDYHEMYVCRGCKQMAHMQTGRVPTCRFCQDKKKQIVKVEIPYACKLLIQELQSMCISVGLDTEVL
ncbi:hypothetical protein R1flu_024404 [Riccia fluitans]|uniref:DNA-directed RNA polymerase subunit beta n=1 Tax=Riccia fluitans TaxID=41844 RepID=A0ABD1XUS8_9MARC